MMRIPLLACALFGVPAASTAHSQTSRAPSSRIEEHSLRSARYAYDRRFWVYTPPGYSPTRAGGYPLLIVFDGADHRDSADTPVRPVLDSLERTARTPAFVAVLVDDSSFATRTAELGNSARFSSFLAEEVVPWVREHYAVTRDPHRTIVAGESAGGLAAAYVAFQRPDVFGNVLSQSGAFWRGNEGSNSAPYEWLTAQYATAPKRDVRLVLDVGSRETIRVLGGSGPVFIEVTRRFRDALMGRGYAVTYTEVPGGVHAPQTWGPRFPVDLVTLAGAWDR